MKLAFIFFIVVLRYIDATFIQNIPLETLHPKLKSLKRYEIVQPVQYGDKNHEIKLNDLEKYQNEDTNDHRKNVYFSITINGTDYKLDLLANENLLSSAFSVSYQSSNGKLITQPPSQKLLNHCYYQGKVRGLDDSYAMFSTCNGGLNGVIVFSDDVAIVEPLPPHLHGHPSGNHVVYRRHDDLSESRDEGCGNDHNDDFIKTFTNGLNQKDRFKRDVTNERKFVEFTLVVDNEEFNRFSSIGELETQMVSLVNLIDGLYTILGISVIFSHLVIWNVRNEIPESTNPTTVLENFANYRFDNITINTDAVHLIYGGNFDGSTVGKATTQTICTPSAVGVNQGGPRSLLNLASIMAHELGHNFGMDHDTAECSCPDRLCIMAATASSRNPPRQWSSCSRDFLTATLNMGLGTCLLNVPAPDTILGGPRCGNEIVETGEECDCGPPNSCQSTCCDPSTCRLLSGASCDDGLCCSGCQFRQSGLECRPTNGNTCDLPEFCTGASGDCPADFFVENGMACNSGNNLCYEGVCLTRNSQCVANWGSGASNAADLCYNSLNIRGDTVGNCGYNGANYIPCTSGNNLCGKLFCVGGADTPTGFRGSGTFTFTRNSEVTPCKLIVSTPTDVGLILDGTVCGSNMACMNGECTPTNPTRCTSSCNGNGVCNNEGNCHCNAGWAPPSCTRSGIGGSINSGGSISLRVTGCPVLIATNPNVQIRDRSGSQAPYTTGEQVAYFCTSGELVGSQTRSCLSTGQWSGSEPNCVATTATVATTPATQCPTLSASNRNVVIQNAFGSQAPYTSGEQVVYFCTSGEIVGSQFRTCLASGQWTGSQPTCQIVEVPPGQCPTLIATNMYVEIRNGPGSTAPYTTGEQVIYSCTSGDLVGSQSRTCLATGQWTGSQPTCMVTVIQCPTLTATNENVEIRNPFGSQAPYTNGEQVVYSCTSGEIVGSQTRTCLSTGQWTGSQPTCSTTGTGETPQCPSLTATNPNVIIRNAVGSQAPYTSGEQVVYVCISGELVGPLTRTCLSNGVWTGAQPICLETACPRLVPLTSNIVIQNFPGSNEPFRAGERVVYSCSRGTLQGNPIRTCQENAIWTGREPTCSGSERTKAFYLVAFILPALTILLNYLF